MPPEAGAGPPRARSRSERKADALERLRDDVDLWVASADGDGNAFLIPLSFYWDGKALTIATPRASRTGRNLLRAGSARVALGHTRDVVIVEGALEKIPIEAEAALGDAYARATGWDPRLEPSEHLYLKLSPRTVLAWRESNELKGRRLMRDGEWLD
jgi:hypothetical protein